jgi:hypothetical protein
MAWRYTSYSKEAAHMFYSHVMATACFNVCTGDIGPSHPLGVMMIPLLIHYSEDAPAPSALHSFQTYISDGKIYVTADPAKTNKEKMSRPPMLLASGTELGGAGVVIVGGGSGAFHAVESLREASCVCLTGMDEDLTLPPARIQGADHYVVQGSECTHRQVGFRVIRPRQA